MDHARMTYPAPNLDNRKQWTPARRAEYRAIGGWFAFEPLYLEPSGSKREWIEQNGIPTVEQEFPFGGKAVGYLPVVFLDNGLFQALAVIFSKPEARRLRDRRPDGLWFKVPATILRETLGEAQWKTL